MNQKLLESLKQDCLQMLQILGIMKAKETQPKAVIMNPPLTPEQIQANAAQANVTTMQPTVQSGGGNPLLDRFCTLIRNYEGIPGDPNYLNNNPGDVRYNEDGYLPKYEPVTKSPAGFAVFPSYEIGWMYLQNMITQRIENHPNWTLLQFFQGIETTPGVFEGGYAPASDGNDPILYAQTIGKGLSVDYTIYQIKNILA